MVETRTPLPAPPSRTPRYDDEYERRGVGNVFTTVEPRVGWRHVTVTERRTAVDFAEQMRWLVDERYPEADVIRVVLDNLNTHRPAAVNVCSIDRSSLQPTLAPVTSLSFVRYASRRLVQRGGEAPVVGGEPDRMEDLLDRE